VAGQGGDPPAGEVAALLAEVGRGVGIERGVEIYGDEQAVKNALLADAEGMQQPEALADLAELILAEQRCLAELPAGLAQDAVACAAAASTGAGTPTFSDLDRAARRLYAADHGKGYAGSAALLAAVYLRHVVAGSDMVRAAVRAVPNPKRT
jgi:hypothetical protein